MAKGMTKATLGGKLLHPTDYIAAVECQGRDVTLTIAGVVIEELRRQSGGKEKKPILTFKETKKKLVLNKTNAGTIADIHGTKAEEWVGKKITVFPTRTQCGGDTTDCIRIRGKVASSTAPVPDAMAADPEPHEELDAFSNPPKEGETTTPEQAANSAKFNPAELG